MTLPSSGPLSMSAINAEFGRGNNLNAYRGTTWYTDAGGSGTFSSGAISFNEFYGKRLTSPQFSFTISSNQTNANLRTLAVNAGWNQSSKVVATIGSGVVISANSTGNTGLTIDGSFPGGVDLINNGYILGMGGAGGYGGGSTYNYPYTNYGQGGAAGGKALAVSVSVSITNNGTIGGGGGGGGGGGMAVNNDKFQTYTPGSGGGGGRTGSTDSAAGGGGNYGSGSNSGAPGTFSSAGSGGAAKSNAAGSTGGAGGAGGNWGANGASGNSGSGTGGSWGGGGGGGAGACLTGNGYISWVATGTRYGAIS